MKNQFREYHQFSKEELRKMWGDCIFVFDANTLLNMYRYSRETVDHYSSVLKELSERNQLWIPHQVGLEFHENRITVIMDSQESYDEMCAEFNSIKDDLGKKYKEHPFLDLEEIREDLNSCLEEITKKVKKTKEEHPKWIKKDDVLDEINEIFDGCVGEPYDEEKLEELYKEGELRYEKKIPPGFKDQKKEGARKYGDLILWKQILDKAKAESKSIIFVSNDTKEDWWLTKKGKRVMPLPELKKEMIERAGVNFHMYTADGFLNAYGESAKSLNPDAVNEVRKVRHYDESNFLEKYNNDFRRSVYRTFPSSYNFSSNRRIFNSGLGDRIGQVYSALMKLIHHLDGSYASNRLLHEMIYLKTRWRSVVNNIPHSTMNKQQEFRELNSLCREILYLLASSDLVISDSTIVKDLEKLLRDLEQETR